MAKISPVFVLSALAMLASAAPVVHLQKRIAQTIADSTHDWEQACLTAGGAQQCNPISQQAFTSLLAAGQNCDQQDAADAMIDLAKTLNNDAEMIRLTQIFVQQPRNAPDSLQVPYCQTAPKNAELNGLFHCQFASSDFTKFSGDQTGNVPLGLTAVNPPGSCPAKPDGPVPDGVQLNTLVQNPVANGSAPGGAANVSSSPATSAAATSAPATSSSAVSPVTSSASVLAATTSSGGFQLQNGEDAIALNDQFASLSADSPCTDGQQACVNGGFAQCVSGKFAITQCAGGTICAALPLVNKPGTSIACTTAADRDARIAATGATSPSTSSGAVTSAITSSVAASAPSTSSAAVLAATTSSSGFQLQNGEDAIALNDQFASLSADSTCTDGQQACVNGGFAQCVGGKFAITQCAGGTICAALPLVNKPGTSIACTTATDRDARIAATGATSPSTSSGAVTSAPAVSAPAASAASATSAAVLAATTSSSGFQLQNGKDAISQNDQFASLTPDSPCTDGDEACVNGGFAQCIGGKFTITQCAGGTICAALPLVNKPGTSITCTTAADRDARIAATGATA